MIVDGIHLNPMVVNLAWKDLGTLRTSLVTDAMAALGMPSGEYQLGGRLSMWMAPPLGLKMAAWQAACSAWTRHCVT